MSTKPSKNLDVFDNPNPERDYEIEFDCPEFTCLCPLTGQPDFAHFQISYVPNKKCVELKSLKMYLWSYRDEGAFHEKVTNQILDNLVEAVNPRMMEVKGEWFVRGGITTYVTVSHVDENWGETGPDDRQKALTAKAFSAFCKIHPGLGACPVDDHPATTRTNRVASIFSPDISQINPGQFFPGQFQSLQQGAVWCGGRIHFPGRIIGRKVQGYVRIKIRHKIHEAIDLFMRIVVAGDQQISQFKVHPCSVELPDGTQHRCKFGFANLSVKIIIHGF